MTFDQYDPFARATRRPLPQDEGLGRGDRPVINVTRAEMLAFIAWLNAGTGRHFRLPSEAEFEFATQGGTTTPYYWGTAASRVTAGSRAAARQGRPRGRRRPYFDLAELAGAVSDIDMAYATVLGEAERVDAAPNSADISAVERARIRKNWAYGVQTSRRATNALFEGAGGSAIYSNSDLQRFRRDLNSASQHQAFGWNALRVDYGLSLVGLDAVGYKLKAR